MVINIVTIMEMRRGTYEKERSICEFYFESLKRRNNFGEFRNFGLHLLSNFVETLVKCSPTSVSATVLSSDVREEDPK
jgi:hypothetical protein